MEDEAGAESGRGEEGKVVGGRAMYVVDDHWANERKTYGSHPFSGQSRGTS